MFARTYFWRGVLGKPKRWWGDNVYDIFTDGVTTMLLRVDSGKLQIYDQDNDEVLVNYDE